ncbi:MAG: hypothetical protein QHI38_06030 [Armatimonadota bacterium]|nr:hypothetical protein [Armatimonadota bacterium]
MRGLHAQLVGLTVLLLGGLGSLRVCCAPRVVTIDDHLRLIVDGRPIFPIVLSPGPPLRAKAPNGRDALDEVKTAGVNMVRLGLFNGEFWNPRTEQLLQHYLDWAHEHDILAAVNLEKLSVIRDRQDSNAKHLRSFLERFSNHPAVAVWKTMDEPQWGKVPVSCVANAYSLIKEWDPNHPCWMNHAPRGTIEEIAEYTKYCDITGVDIYPVSVPMGKHSHLPNKNISVVGDYVKWISKTVEGKKPIWMVLQISFSGAVPPRPVVFPTLQQERYMVYQAIITGAKGLLFFGGTNVLQGRDKELGWNWTFWETVLKPVLSEITCPEMRQVLLEPDAKGDIRASGADDIEFTAKRVGSTLYLLAAKREKPSAVVSFTGLPSGTKRAEVMFENRSIPVSDGSFADSFEPNAVHVYRIPLE